MRAYIIRRLLLIIPTLFLVTMIVFSLIRLMPGSLIDSELAQMKEFGIPIEDREEYRDVLLLRYGLDVSIPVQYGRWLGVVPQADGNFSGVFQGDFGTSFQRGTPVLDDIASRWPVTLELSLIAIIVGQILGLSIGIFSALRQDTSGDYIARSFAILAIAVPGFWLATMVIVFPSIWWGYMPPIILIPFIEDPLGNLRMFIIPGILMGMMASGGTMRMTRTMMLEVLRQDYIRTAWGKGLRERVVVLRHALKNALIPWATGVGAMLPALFGGAVIIEQIFALPGMGRLLIDATLGRDYLVISAIMLIMGGLIMSGNLISDIVIGFLDPRIRYK